MKKSIDENISENWIKQGIIVKTNNRLFKVLPDNVLFIKATDAYSLVFTQYYCHPILASITFKKICERLCHACHLVRCHRSFAVNLPFVSSFCSQRKVLRIEHFLIPISRRNEKLIYNLLLDQGIIDRPCSSFNEISEPENKHLNH